MWIAASFVFICFSVAQRPMLPKWSAQQCPAMVRKRSERQRPAAPRSTEAKGGADAGAKASTGINKERHGTGEAMRGRSKGWERGKRPGGRREAEAEGGRGGPSRGQDGGPKPTHTQQPGESGSEMPENRDNLRGGLRGGLRLRGGLLLRVVEPPALAPPLPLYHLHSRPPSPPADLRHRRAPSAPTLPGTSGILAHVPLGAASNRRPKPEPGTSAKSAGL